MGKPVIIINSVTQAMKAKQILSRHGISSEVLKNRASKTGEGCSYNLVVRGSVNRAEEILKKSGVNMVGVAEV